MRAKSSSKVSLDNNHISVKNRIGVSVVREAKSGDLIIKLVNMLPVSVNTDLEIPSLKGKNAMAVRTILTGQPSDREVRPVSGNIEIGEQYLYELPAYSFTVIRIINDKE